MSNSKAVGAMENMESTEQSQEYEDVNNNPPDLLKSLNADLRGLNDEAMKGAKECPGWAKQKCHRIIGPETEQQRQKEKERRMEQELYEQEMRKLADDYFLSLMKPQYIDIEHASLSQVLHAYRRTTSQEERRNQFTN